MRHLLCSHTSPIVKLQHKSRAETLTTLNKVEMGHCVSVRNKQPHSYGEIRVEKRETTQKRKSERGNRISLLKVI